jgi:hypothetical protein
MSPNYSKQEKRIENDFDDLFLNDVEVDFVFNQKKYCSCCAE